MLHQYRFLYVMDMYAPVSRVHTIFWGRVSEMRKDMNIALNIRCDAKKVYMKSVILPLIFHLA